MESKGINMRNNWFFSFSILLLTFGILLVWMLFAPTPNAQTTTKEIQLLDLEGMYSVDKQMDILLDKEGQWNIADIQTPILAGQFRSASEQSSRKLNAGTYWFRTTIDNQSSLEQWVIRMNDIFIEQLEIFVIDDNTIYTEQSNVLQKVDEHFLSYYVQLPPDETIEIYMRTVINRSTIISINLMDNQTFLKKLANENIFFGGYYGFILLISVYMLAIYVISHRLEYIYCTILIICFGISYLVANGLMQPWLVGIDEFFFLAYLWFGLLFLRRILQLDIYVPQLLNIYRIIDVSSLLVLIVVLFQFPSYAILTIFYKLLFLVLLVISLVWSVNKGNLVARYVILAAIAFLGIATPAILHSLDLIQESFLTSYGFQIGSIANYIILSIALTYHVKQAHRDQEIELQEILTNERVQQTRDELIQDISNDIRTPLMAVQGGIQAMIMDNEVDSKEMKHLQTIYDKVNHANAYIDELVDSQQEQPVEYIHTFETVYFADWIQHEFESLAPMIESKGLTYKSSITADPYALITINPSEIRRVLANLMHNACKFSSEGQTVFLHASSSNGEVLVCVEDEGIGIAAEHIQAIFDRSFRVDPSSPLSGSGLGLTIAKEIINRHNGLIWSDSQVGFGSLFYFKMPVDLERS